MRDQAHFLAVVLCAALAFAIALLADNGRAPDPAVFAKHRDSGYLGSGSCRSCHPSEHASWQRSYHSTMTRRASELSWDGKASPQLPVQLELYSRTFRIEEKEGRVTVSGPDLHAVGRKLSALAQENDASRSWKRHRAEELFSTEQEVTRELVLITGSHHYLAFWLEGGEGRELRQLPFVYLLSEERFLPRQDAFLQPPDALPRVARWNANCIQCHTVAGKPGQSQGTHSETGEFWERYDSEVVDLGIACESFHGPGKNHADHFRNPVERARAHSAPDAPESSIYLPDKKAGPRGSETCGQCHSYFVPRDENEWWSFGFSRSYRAGDPLAASRLVLSPEEDGGPASAESLRSEHEQAASLIDAHRDSIFWNDGSMIVGGREYNGLVQSPCFQRGTGSQRLACTSCHSLHQGNPDGQLVPNRNENTMCTQCHEEIGKAHSRHKSGSAAAQCTSCHMPKTSYALLQGLASHRISSPKARFQSPPNACTLCHVDRSESWLLSELERFGVKVDRSSPQVESRELPIAAVRALRGNAAERAIYAFALGSPETLNAAGSEVSERILPFLKKDPYAAVRLIAERSLLEVKKVGPRASKTQLRLDASTLNQLVKERDETPIVISE